MMARQIEQHLRTSGERPCQFGRRVAKDPNLVSDIRRGRTVGPNLRQRIEQAIIAARNSDPNSGKTPPGD